MNRENTLHGASEHTEVEQVHTIRTQVLSIGLEALKLALGLIWLHIAVGRLLVGVSTWLPTLAHYACFAARLELCDAAAHLSML